MDLSYWWLVFNQLIRDQTVLTLLRVLLIIGLGFLLARLAVLTLRRVFRETTDLHRAMLLQRGIYYVVILLFTITALRELGFDFGVILGAAGILTVAVGFAAQTSMSNLISGLFLIGERPFAVGDLIQVGQTVGEVLAIDLLSIKLRAFDNTYVRIPNETILKSEVSTLTKFPIRRIDLQFGIAYRADIDKAQTILFDVADKNPLCLTEPQPLFILQGFGESSLNFQFSVWVRREEFLTLKNSIQIEIKSAFEQEGIEIPFPQRDLHLRSGVPWDVLVQSDDGATKR